MTKPTLFEIVYDNPAGVYKAGEIVKGTVNLELPKDLKIRSVTITLLGEAKLKWTKCVMVGDGGGVMAFCGDERYFKQVLFPEGDKNAKDSKTLSAGTYSYPFEMKLPDILPTSFEHQVGKIRFWTECCIDWKTILKAFNYTTQKAFSVVNVFDLNTVTDATGLFEKEDQVPVGCWCCAGSIEASIRMKRKAFVPGELMTFDAEVSNLGSTQVSKTEVVLKQVVKFITTDYQSATKRKRVIRRLEHGPIPSKGVDTWVNEGIIIPPLPPTELKKCRVIKISYVLELNVNPREEFDPEICVPLDIIIGNVPLKDNFDDFNQLASKANISAAPPMLLVAEHGKPPLYEEGAHTAPAAQITPFLPNCPPPTYHESVFGMSNLKDDKDKDDAEVIGSLTFAPVYLTYHYDSTPFELAIDE